MASFKNILKFTLSVENKNFFGNASDFRLAFHLHILVSVNDKPILVNFDNSVIRNKVDIK